MHDNADSVAMLDVILVKGDKGEMALFNTAFITVSLMSYRNFRTCICLPLFCDSASKYFSANISSGTIKNGTFKRGSEALLTLLLATAFFLPILVIL